MDISWKKDKNQSKKGWNDKTMFQTVALGGDAEISLQGEGLHGEPLDVTLTDPSVCAVHERPATGAPHLRRFVFTGLKKGATGVLARLPTPSHDGVVAAIMYVEVTGSQHGFRLVFFPGERTVTYYDTDGNPIPETLGTIYVVGGDGERYSAAGGPPTGYDANQGGHTAEPTPPGHYVLGPRQHVTTTSWPMSVIPWGASLRVKNGEAEYQDQNGRWRLATGRNGEVTQAQIQYQSRSRGGDKLTRDQIIDGVRAIFIDPDTGKLLMTTWEYNDFGKWGWNLRALPGKTATAYYVHTTDGNERDAEAKLSILLTNSHGCVHLVPSQRDEMMDKGYLKEGVEFEVRRYNEVGPP